MRLGLLSDTHDKLLTIDVALDYFSQQRVDLVLHCGDWKSQSTVAYFARQAHELSLTVRGVLGNNDLDVQDFLRFAASAPGDFALYEGVYAFVTADSRHVAVYHGHHKPTLRKLLEDTRHDIVALGHTHKPRVERRGDQLLVNPGSTAFAIPRSKTWLPSVAIIDTVQFDATIKYLA